MGKITRRKRDNKNRTIKTVGIISGILFFLYFGFTIYYSKHFFGGTIINGVDCSRMTVKKAEDEITASVRNYVLTFEERDNKTEQIVGSDIELVTLFDSDLEEIKKKQNPFLWMFSFKQKKEFNIKTMLSFNEQVLKRYFDALECFKEENVVKPVDAYITDYQNGGYEIVEAEFGNLVKKDKLYDLVVQAINTLNGTINLDKEECYEAPTYTADSEEIINACNTLNTYVSSEIKYEFGEAVEILDGTKINEWLSVTEEQQVVLDETKLREFVDYLGSTYNTFGKTRTLRTSYNQTIQITGGDYGWWLNRDAEQNELADAIKEGQKTTRKPVYRQEAAQYGDDDVGNTYVEINLTAQRLFFYKDGNLLVESDLVSGNVSKNDNTPTGTYPIVYKERGATLKGEDYETPVDYWMPFYQNVGMHDAPWRGEFGKNIYLTRGSHGCVNLPPEKARIIFENISKGVAVFCYELPGTENY